VEWSQLIFQGSMLVGTAVIDFSMGHTNYIFPCQTETIPSERHRAERKQRFELIKQLGGGGKCRRFCLSLVESQEVSQNY
jgi:hypothetical protein